MSSMRISRFVDPEIGGKRVEFLSSVRHTTVRHAGFTRETTTEHWMHAGILMEPITNHVKEQPTSYAEKLLQAHLKANRGEI